MIGEKKPIFAKHHSWIVVGVIDIVGSTALLEPLDASDVDEFYTIFLREISGAVRHMGGVALKNTGDGLLFYFKATDSQDTKAFEAALQGGRDLLKKRGHLNEEFIRHGLPTVNYRVSMSYGPVSAMLDSRKRITDIFGAVVSTCAKMNKLARPNTLVIGEALHAKTLPTSIEAQEIGSLSIAPGKSFAVYEVQ
jgi:class 3 adenylate cyclase